MAERLNLPFPLTISRCIPAVNAGRNTAVNVVTEMVLSAPNVVQKNIPITIRSIPDDVGLIYSISGIWGKSVVGRVDSNGYIYTGVFGGNFVGTVDNSGKVYSYSTFGRGEVLGRVASTGFVYSGAFGGDYLGQVDDNGVVYDTAGISRGSVIGRADPPFQREGGAAFLLLFRK